MGKTALLGTKKVLGSLERESQAFKRRQQDAASVFLPERKVLGQVFNRVKRNEVASMQNICNRKEVAKTISY